MNACGDRFDVELRFFFVLAKRADTLELCPVQGIVRRTIFDESYLAYAYIAHCMWEATKKRKPQKIRALFSVVGNADGRHVLWSTVPLDWAVSSVSSELLLGINELELLKSELFSAVFPYMKK